MHINKNTLENGLSVVTVPMSDTPTATAMVMVNAGSRFETAQTNGVSHFLEHMFFKGTENRPSSHAVSVDFDKLGAESNAFTGHEYTAYYGKAQADRTEPMLNILADIYKNSLFPEEEIEKEAGVITEEIRMYNDLPMRRVHDNFQGLVFPDQSIGYPILGPSENVQSFQRSDFLEYKNNHYVPEKTVVVVAGGIEPNSIEAQIVEEFAGLATASEIEPEPAAASTNKQLHYQQKDCDQSHLVVGAPAVARESEKLPAVEILSTILGRGMSSRLFKKLRDEMGVCYYVRSSTEYYTDTGLFKISTGVTPDRLAEVVEVITDTVTQVAKHGVKQDELDKAKEFAAGNFLLNHETTDDIARDIAKQSVLDAHIETPSEYTKRLRSVSEASVVEVAKRMTESDLQAAVIGPSCDESEVLTAMQ